MSGKPNKSAHDYRDDMVRTLRDSHALKSWSELIEAVDVPMDLAAALATGRVELLKLAQPRAMDAEEVMRLYKLIGVLIDTNFALQAHAREVSSMAATAYSQIRGALTYSRKLQQFAGFSVSGDGDEEC